MAIVKIITKYCSGRGEFESNNPDTFVHLPGSGSCGTETICGYVDTGHEYRYGQGEVTCPGCLDVARQVLSNLTPKEIEMFRSQCKRKRSRK